MFRNTQQFGATEQRGTEERGDCEALCTADRACTGYDFDTRPVPYAGVRCWGHAATAGDRGTLGGVNHYEKGGCTGASTPTSTATTTGITPIY